MNSIWLKRLFRRLSIEVHDLVRKQRRPWRLIINEPKPEKQWFKIKKASNISEVRLDLWIRYSVICVDFLFVIPINIFLILYSNEICISQITYLSPAAILQGNMLYQRNSLLGPTFKPHRIVSGNPNRSGHLHFRNLRFIQRQSSDAHHCFAIFGQTMIIGAQAIDELIACLGLVIPQAFGSTRFRVSDEHRGWDVAVENFIVFDKSISCVHVEEAVVHTVGTLAVGLGCQSSTQDSRDEQIAGAYLPLRIWATGLYIISDHH